MPSLLPDRRGEVQRPTTFSTQDEATAWLAGERADRARGIWPDLGGRKLTLSQYADAYLTNRADLAPRTQHGYRRLIERYVDNALTPRRGRALTLGAIELAELDPATICTCQAADVDAAASAAQHAGHGCALAPIPPARAWAIEEGWKVLPTGKLPRP
jgi:hypothetical protein